MKVVHHLLIFMLLKMIFMNRIVYYSKEKSSFKSLSASSIRREQSKAMCGNPLLLRWEKNMSWMFEVQSSPIVQKGLYNCNCIIAHHSNSGSWKVGITVTQGQMRTTTSFHRLLKTMRLSSTRHVRLTEHRTEDRE